VATTASSPNSVSWAATPRSGAILDLGQVKEILADLGVGEQDG
jgi:hypothetical protein